MGLRNADFIAAVRLQGASPARIIFAHVLPMCLPSAIVRITLSMAGVILTAAGLGFRGRNLETFGFLYRKRGESMLTEAEREGVLGGNWLRFLRASLP